MSADLELIALETGHYRRLLQIARDRGIAGGVLYDAVIMACAEAGKADALLTFNARDFRRVVSVSVQIVVLG
jgi:predicted nucleic acid-binding protein